MKLLLIDNYDSFTFNLVQRIWELDPAIPIQFVRNDEIDAAGAEAIAPTHLLLSPGPCTPAESGVCRELIPHFRGRIPILGVCLGHQTMADVHGIPVLRHERLMHGKTSPIHHDGRGIYEGLPNPFVATRYHSLIVRREDVRGPFEVSAWTAEDEVMGLRWTGGAAGAGQAPMDGVQFHPESFLSVHGPRLLARFLWLADPGPSADAGAGAGAGAIAAGAG